MWAIFRALIGIFSQTAGSTCEVWVNPVNFTFSGFQAEVVVVSDFDELEEQGRAGRLRGNMVLIDFPWEGYGRSVHYRCTAGPSGANQPE